ncbi:hypothetical protein BAAM0499_03345 [Bifidobacterium animalis subsp. animalis MCC 0499]|nr:hypothetical protein BAAM0499_03345 [Bifidobacterium animalis subsp. animalis MCC 0499]
MVGWADMPFMGMLFEKNTKSGMTIGVERHDA